MIITVPMAPNQTIAEPVKASLLAQTLQWPIYEIRAGISCVGLSRAQRIHNIVISRNKCIDRMMDHDFGLMHDSDCIMLKPDNLEKAFDFLMQNKSYIAVALRKEDWKNHGEGESTPACGSWLIRGYLFNSFDLAFRYSDEKCECRNMCAGIAETGWKIGYPDDEIRVKDLHLP